MRAPVHIFTTSLDLHPLAADRVSPDELNDPSAIILLDDGRKLSLWRTNVHSARRRVILVVLVTIRLRQGLNHPQRLRRVDSFSFYIPQVGCRPRA